MFRQLRYTSIVFAVVLLVAAACGPAANPSASPGASASASPSASAGTAATTLVIDQDVSDLISLDPAIVYEFSGVLLAHNVYDTLVRFEGTDLSTIKPGLAQSWDTKDAGTTWDMTFKLKTGQKFASGNAVTADDVVYSFQRAIKLTSRPPSSSPTSRSSRRKASRPRTRAPSSSASRRPPVRPRSSRS